MGKVYLLTGVSEESRNHFAKRPTNLYECENRKLDPLYMNVTDFFLISSSTTVAPLGGRVFRRPANNFENNERCRYGLVYMREVFLSLPLDPDAAARRRCSLPMTAMTIVSTMNTIPSTANVDPA